MANFFKKKGVAISGIQMSDSEAALAQSDFNIEKITEIQNRFTGNVVLLYPGRIFIREGLLWKVCRKGPKKRQFFLFNDILVYGSVVANRYSNQQILPLSQMSVSAECFYQPRVNADFDEDSEQMELDAGNAFQISHANKSFHVFALSSADKANWLANLHKHINRVAQSVTNDSQLLTKPVWVPDSMSKECMVCSVKFTAFIRKHHCRRCGRVVCTTCSPHRMAPNPHAKTSQYLSLDTKKMERVCKDCFKDMSSMNSRLVPQVQQPPTAAVAAQVVSNVLQSASTFAKNEGHDSSTDTDDSDDSENEKEEEISTVMNIDDSTRVSLPEDDSQPTPPPRKKKLKKKLEQLVEQNLNKDDVKGGQSELTPPNEETTNEPLENDKSTSDTLEADSDLGKEQLENAKKSRRRRKHMQAGDAVNEDTVNDLESDKNCEEILSESLIEISGLSAAEGTDTDVKKARSRKTKFK